MGKIKNRSHQQFGLSIWLVMCFTALYMLIAPFYKGLFNGYYYNFEGPIYGAIIAGVIVFGVIIYYLARNWKIESHRDLLAIFVWFIPLTYWISSFGAASGHLAANEVIVKYLWAVFFMIGAFFTDTEKKSFVFQTIFMISGYVLVLFGFLNWFGNYHYEDAVLNGRLSNVFQYPNAYAAVLIGLLFSNLIYANRISNIYAKMAVNAMLVPLVLSFILTLSRGALLVIPIVLLVYLLLLHWRNQISNIIHLAIVGIAAFIIFNPITQWQASVNTSSDLQSVLGWGALIVTSLVVSAFIFLFEKYIPSLMKSQKTESWSWVNLTIPLAMIFMFGAVFVLLTRVEGIHRILPEEISGRFKGLSTETASFYERNTFYQDALSLTNDFPLFGAGGGAWSTLYNTYKSYPYTSTQAHNFYFQYLVESGWVGTIVFLAFILYLTILFVKKWTKSSSRLWNDGRLMYPIFAFSILMHSFVDFDMSFVYIATIVMMMLGATAAIGSEPRNRIVKTLNSVKRHKVIVSSIVSLFAITALIVFFSTVISLKAHSAFAESQLIARTTGSYPQMKPKLDEALDLKPHHPDYQLFKINVMYQLYEQTNDPMYIQEVSNSLSALSKEEPYNRMVLEYLINQYLAEGRYDDVRSAYYRLMEIYPWDMRVHERAVEFFVDIGLETNDFSDVFMIKQILEERFQQLNTLPEQLQHKYRRYKINQILAYHFARAHFAQRDFDQSAELLAEFLSPNLKREYNLLTLRLYIASLHAVNKDDEMWKNRLYKYDPMEEHNVQQMIDSILIGEES